MSTSTSGKIPVASSQEQIDLLHKSKVIQVSTDDKAIGPLSKLESHLWANISNKNLYHRAFSVLLFEKSTGSMLIQKRAANKITYPSMWANACCSHPEYNDDENTVGNFPDIILKYFVSSQEPPTQGVVAAAYRRLEQELGIKKDELIQELHPLTRIKYSARCSGDGSDFGEAEIDYILIGFCKDQIPVVHNPEEVEETRWVSDLRELRRLPRSHHYVFTPWFELLAKDEECLELWWPTIKKTGDLGRITDMGIFHFPLMRPPPPAAAAGGRRIRALNVMMVVTAVRGHLMGLDFEQEYRGRWDTVDPETLYNAPLVKSVASDMGPVAGNLRRLARTCDWLVLWLDCDREGEAIAYEVIEIAREANARLNVYRANFSALTHADLTRACLNLARPNPHLAAAVDARQEIDLRIGASFTRFLTLRYKRRLPLLEGILSYGPCQFPTLGFVVQRWLLQRNFIREPFWTIKCTVSGPMVEVKLLWGRHRLFDHLATTLLYDRCLQHVRESGGGVVTHVSHNPKSRWRPLPLSTVEFAKLASSKLRIDSRQAMRIAEELYNRGIISYPRTETDRFNPNIDLLELSTPWAPRPHDEALINFLSQNECVVFSVDDLLTDEQELPESLGNSLRSVLLTRVLLKSLKYVVEYLLPQVANREYSFHPNKKTLTKYVGWKSIDEKILSYILETVQQIRAAACREALPTESTESPVAVAEESAREGCGTTVDADSTCTTKAASSGQSEDDETLEEFLGCHAMRTTQLNNRNSADSEPPAAVPEVLMYDLTLYEADSSDPSKKSTVSVLPDTGAGRSFVSHAWLKINKSVVHNYKRTCQSLKVKCANGTTFHTNRQVLLKVSRDGVAHPWWFFVTDNLSHAHICGMDFLRGLRFTLKLTPQAHEVATVQEGTLFPVAAAIEAIFRRTEATLADFGQDTAVCTAKPLKNEDTLVDIVRDVEGLPNSHPEPV
ncbi:prokaryotic dna topoisomerase, putative [Perkinsus marinus ATCC 50983]|uniref:DNA topoisomerase n=1 Tax=Perkinsus marinus (strain ATCC 50983 / TXsc) TaxID=423536 RepID=C5LAZ3_PERM5|nr:prokaryotic dna topoisomerase, putative [Perkinsus marinus ATCC 50983]EER06087.1 prokaryotic dna topoisomerase, putative [Perkinsus marinus ATCC 50983]|eukprot:XP_002774271.1 prokaryotic dna topoisomerase, putative [Perkinsus marinus ATCC 50983]